jgi:hypothetical protein
LGVPAQSTSTGSVTKQRRQAFRSNLFAEESWQKGFTLQSFTQD